MEIAIVGMLVVFTALTLISVFISLLPSVLRVVHLIYPLKDHGTMPVRTDAPSDEVLVAIVSAFHAAETG